MLALVIHTFWLASQSNPPMLEQRVQDLQILVIILLALSSLYTVVFLLSPSVSDRILRQQAEHTVKAVKTQLAKSVEELREVKEEFRRIMLGNEKLIRQLRSDTLFWSGTRAEVTEATAPAHETAMPAGGFESAQRSDRSQEVPEVDDELVKIDQALSDPLSKQENNGAITYLNGVIGRTSDPVAAAHLRYTRGCLLARQGELEKALREIEMAFLNKSPELDQKLAKDTEEGGPLFELASREPYDQVILDLLMNVSVGA